MANIKDYAKFEGFGVKGNALNPADLAKVVVAGLVIIFGFAASQNLASGISRKLPLDNKIDPIVSTPPAESGYKRQYF